MLDVVGRLHMSAKYCYSEQSLKAIKDHFSYITVMRMLSCFMGKMKFQALTLGEYSQLADKLNIIYQLWLQ